MLAYAAIALGVALAGSEVSDRVEFLNVEDVLRRTEIGDVTGAGGEGGRAVDVCSSAEKTAGDQEYAEYNHLRLLDSTQPEEAQKARDALFSSGSECDKCMRSCFDDTVGRMHEEDEELSIEDLADVMANFATELVIQLTTGLEFVICLDCCAGEEIPAFTEENSVPETLRGKTCANAEYGTLIDDEEEKKYFGMFTQMQLLIVGGVAAVALCLICVCLCCCCSSCEGLCCLLDCCECLDCPCLNCITEAICGCSFGSSD